MPDALPAPPSAGPASPTNTPSPAGLDPSQRPIKVLIVDTAIAFGGTLVVARNLLQHLDPRLVDASLVSACADGFVSNGFAGKTEIRLLAPRVNYVTLQNWKQAIRRQFRWKPIRRSLELMAMGTEFLANTFYVIHLVRICRKMKIQVVHVNNFAMEPLWAARLLGIPIVSHLHGLVHLPLERSRRRILPHVNAFVSISKSVTDSALRAGLDRTRIHNIPNFVEHTPEGSPPALPAEPAIGIFGRVTNWKGQKEFLLAAMRVLQKFPHVKIYVVGDASDGDTRYFDECRELAQSSPFSNQFEFTGRVTNVSAYYRKCTVVAHASICPEPFGMVLIEAMAEARPVVASTLGAPSEIIKEGVEGYLVDPTDSAAMANRINTLLSDPALATAMGLRGRQKVLAQYDPTVTARRFERLYIEVSNARGQTKYDH